MKTDEEKRAWIVEYLGVKPVERPALDDVEAWRLMGYELRCDLTPGCGLGPSRHEFDKCNLLDRLPNDICKRELDSWLFAARRRHEEGLASPRQVDQLVLIGWTVRKAADLTAKHAYEVLTAHG